MTAKQKPTSFGPPVPELPVADVERAQQHYRDTLGFEIGWLYPNKGIGAVSREKSVIFFRRRVPPFGRHRRVLSGTAVGRCEHRRTSGEKALGIAAIYRKGSGREPLLLPP
jgi:catechol 2,3-dioxygenase-like lactoylglutathione lyase family enzyme